MSIEFAVGIVNYNTRDRLRDCVRSVLSESPSEVVIVDNASTDGSADMVRDEFPDCLLIANSKNGGYGAGANVVFGVSRSERVLVLNGDTRLRPGSLKALADYLDERPRAGVVGPRLLNSDGTLQPSCYPFPGLLNTLFVNTRLGGLLRYVPVARALYLPLWAHDRDRIVPWVVGAALAVRRGAFMDAGGFDERYFMYFEEVDLCYRLRETGWEVHFTPRAEVEHEGAASTDQIRSDMAVRFFVSALRFHRLHYSAGRRLGLAILLRAIMAGRWTIDRARLMSARDAGERERLEADVAAWRKALFGPWQGQVSGG